MLVLSARTAGPLSCKIPAKSATDLGSPKFGINASVGSVRLPASSSLWCHRFRAASGATTAAFAERKPLFREKYPTVTGRVSCSYGENTLDHAEKFTECVLSPTKAEFAAHATPAVATFCPKLEALQNPERELSVIYSFLFLLRGHSFQKAHTHRPAGTL